MNVQTAAHRILTDTGHPISAREIAKKALAAGLVNSNSKDPILSIAGTIEKTIRGEKYNDPQLVFVSTVNGRKVALPSMCTDSTNGNPMSRESRSDRSVEDDGEWVAACKAMLNFAARFGQDRVLRFMKACFEQS